MRSEQTTLPVGTLLRGRYLLKNILGAGNSGTVYLVKDQQPVDGDPELLALKEMLRLDPQERQQFTLNEKFLCDLRHPALPSIYSIFSDETHERAYLLMDYAEGVDLGTLCQEQPDGYFAWSDLQGILRPVFEALAFLHGQVRPVFHGDVKPLNLIRQTGVEKIVLVDLGYTQAIVTDPHRQFTSVALSNYRAPEHLAGHVDALTDIYELGATLYMLLTGQPPLDASTRLRQVRRDEPDPLLAANRVASSVSRACSDALQQALALDPEQRFPSVQSFWHALNAVSSTMPELTSQDGGALLWGSGTGPGGQRSTSGLLATRLSRKNVLRRPLLAAIAIISVLLLIIAGAGTWIIAGQHRAGTGSILPSHTASVVQATPVGKQKTTPTSQTGNYPNISGVYLGTLTPLAASQRDFSLTIQQQQGHLSGTFSSSEQNGTFIGTIDISGAVNFVVSNAAGHALYTFTGGLNGTGQISDSMGGTFYNCTSTSGATCQEAAGSTGTWTLSQSTAFLPGGKTSSVHTL